MVPPLARVARAANLGRACPCNEGVAPMALIPRELYRDDRERKDAPISEDLPSDHVGDHDALDVADVGDGHTSGLLLRRGRNTL